MSDLIKNTCLLCYQSPWVDEKSNNTILIMILFSDDFSQVYYKRINSQIGSNNNSNVVIKGQCMAYCQFHDKSKEGF